MGYPDSANTTAGSFASAKAAPATDGSAAGELDIQKVFVQGYRTALADFADNNRGIHGWGWAVGLVDKNIQGPDDSAEAKIARVLVFGLSVRSLKGARGIGSTSSTNKNVLLEALAKAKPTSGHPNQLMTTLEDGSRVIFRKDFGQQAHPIGGPFQGQGRIDHYNIEVQSASGRTIENIHAVPNGPGRFIFWGKDGEIKQ